MSVTFFRVFLKARLGHPDNTDTLACPLGIGINRVSLYCDSRPSVEEITTGKSNGIFIDLRKATKFSENFLNAYPP